VVKRQLSQKILFGEWPPGTVLPAEIALARDLGVAVGTVRRALADLVSEGLVARGRKTGTVVTSRSYHHNLRNYFQYFRLHGKDESHKHSQARVVSLSRGPADANIAQKLQLEEGEMVVQLHRVRVVDEQPVIHDRYTIAVKRVPDFPMEMAAVPQRLSILLLERYGIRIAAVREFVSAEIADALDRKLLHLKHPAAVMAIEDLAYDPTGTPIMHARRRASTAHHIYINEIK
jgi:GntR family transcriptional regulator